MANKKLKLPPQDLEAETSVLGALLIDKNAMVKVADILTPTDFYHPAHQLIYECILDLFEKGKPIDILTVRGRLKETKKIKEAGGAKYLAELVASVPTSAHIAEYAEIVREKRVRRDLIAASSEINEKAMEYDDFEHLLDEVEGKIFSIAGTSRTQKFIPVREDLSEAYERFERLHRREGDTLRGIPTGFTSLDNILSGLQKSDLILLGARPSYGKTSFALDIARQTAEHGVSVGIFSIEMSREQVVDRLIASQAQVPLWHLRTGRLRDDMEFSMIQEALDSLSKMKIFIDDTPSPNILQMRSMARRLQMDHGLDLLIIDYLQLIQPRNPRESMVQQVTEISRGLKALARELKIPVFAISQLSRGVEQREDKYPRLADLRESGCLTGDTLITRADTGERIPIKILAERTSQSPIPVFAVDGDYKIRTFKMTKAFPSGKKHVFVIKTKSGRTIRASGNHPFLHINGWKRVEELRVGDTVGIPRRLNPETPTNPLSKDELILLAHLLGDGCILPKQPFHYTNADLKNINHVRRAAYKLFSITGRLIRQKNLFHLYLPSPYHLTHGKYHPITNWFNKLGIGRVRSSEKRIPENVFRCDETRIALFLRHLWSTDGNISWRYLPGRKPSGNIYYATRSSVFAEQIQHLLLRLGIQSTIRTQNSKKGYRPMYHIHIQSAVNQILFLEKIGIANSRKKIVPEMLHILRLTKQNPNNDVLPKTIWQTHVAPAKIAAGISWQEFSKRIETAYCGSTLFKHGVSRDRMERIATACIPEPAIENSTALSLWKKLHKRVEADIYWDTITAIEPRGMEEVYDATVDGAHNFVANDFVVHNSLEQDADVVLLMHRKDRGRKDVKKDEENLVDIIIAKHRNGPLGKAQLYFDPEKVSFRNIDKVHTEENKI